MFRRHASVPRRLTHQVFDFLDAFHVRGDLHRPNPILFTGLIADQLDGPLPCGYGDRNPADQWIGCQCVPDGGRYRVVAYMASTTSFTPATARARSMARWR